MCVCVCVCAVCVCVCVCVCVWMGVTVYKLFHTHTSLSQDDLVDYNLQHKKFPDSFTKAVFPRNYWSDIIVAVWICLLGVPAFLAALYLAWMGAWLTLGVIVIAIFVGKITCCV